MELFGFILLGLTSGFFAGLLGLGGGIITVPVMALVALPYLNFPAHELMHIAVASSLAAIIPTALMSIYGHQHQRGIIWPIALKFTPGLIIGGVSGALLASSVASQGLQFAFASFLIFVAMYMLFSPVNMLKTIQDKVKINSLVPVPIAFISASLGVGGGTMTVPYLLGRGVELPKAIGISAYCGLPIAVASSLTFYIMQSMSFSNVSGQFIYFPAVLGIIIGSIISAPLGAKCTHLFPLKLIKRLFSIVLLIASAKLFMIW